MFADNFNRYKVGAFPGGGWEFWFGGTGSTDQIVAYTNFGYRTRPLQLRGVDFWAGLAAKRFPSSASIIGYQVDVCVSQLGGKTRDDARVTFDKLLSPSASREYAPVLFNDDGPITASGQIPRHYVAGKWYKVAVVLNRATQTYWVWINGVLRGRNLSAGTYTLSEIEAFAVMQCYNNVKAYFDNVQVSSYK